MIIDPAAIKTSELHTYLQGAIAPRPICFASTVDADGQPNLSPFSFFNIFGTNPPTLIFSPARRVRDNTVKHTLENVIATKEVVINVVTYSMVQQTSLSSCDYPQAVSEFAKAGFTPLASEKVKPFRVAESPVQLECVVKQIIETGQGPGAGNLVICEPVLIHLDDRILNDKGQIDPHKIDLVARMGADFYCRASGNAVFEVAKPNLKLGIGIDALPPAIRFSRVLTGNHLGQLANIEETPAIDATFDDHHLKQIFQYYSLTPDEMETELHRYAALLLDNGKVYAAWQVLISQ